MATQAHCAYCFEILTAKLERRTPLTLRQAEQLWKQYNADPSALDPGAPDDDDVEAVDESNAPTTTTGSDSYRPAAISRLTVPSPASRSSSSVQSALSTPSGTSEASSAASKNSSRSSIFSLGNRLRHEQKQRSEEGSPLFVTWNVLGKGEKRLRGCIGTFEAQELEDGLRSYALTSAFDDTRFHPIAHRELPSLECGVTLLTDFEPVADPMDWVIGTHGLRISFTHNHRRYGSTYLPDVAREQGWTKEETMVSLMRKAGWTGRREDWSKVDLNVVRYQGQQVRLDYKAWKEWRDWVEGGEV